MLSHEQCLKIIFHILTADGIVLCYFCNDQPSIKLEVNLAVYLYSHQCLESKLEISSRADTIKDDEEPLLITEENRINHVYALQIKKTKTVGLLFMMSSYALVFP